MLAEFEQLLTAGKYVSTGGIDFARGALERAFGPRRAQGLLDRVNSTAKSGFQMLRNVDPSQIIPFVSKEHPQTIALILSQLDPLQAAGVLAGLSEGKQADVAFRIAQMEHISPQVIRDLEENLAQDLEAILSGQVTDIGGPKTVAEILNRVGRSTERAVLERLDANDPELAESIRNQMFVFDDISQLTDREIQMLLREVDTKDLGVALKGAAEDLRERILGNMSDRVAGMLREEMEFLGPVRMSDVEEMQLRVVQTVRQLEEAGQITVVRGDGSEVLL